MNKLLDWDNMPPIGTKVKFLGYSDRHEHWGFVEGEVYEIGEDKCGVIGPINYNGSAPPRNFDNSFQFEILEQTFTKSDLKDGMRVTTRNGHEFYVCGSKYVEDNACRDFLGADGYEEDLTSIYGDKWDIVKVVDRDDTILYDTTKPKYNFTKADLKDGMTVTCANGWVRVYLNGSFLFPDPDMCGAFRRSFSDIELEDDLTHFDQPEVNIVKVVDRDGEVMYER